MLGLANVPGSVKDAARGMGLTDRQILWRVELPLATPEIVAGLRIATVSTVAIATLAVFAGGGGLGTQIFGDADINFTTNIIIAGGIAILMALAFDVDPAGDPAAADALATGGDGMSALASSTPCSASIEGAIEFIFSPQTSNVTGGKQVGGFDQVVELTLTQLEVTVLALALSLLVALPIGLYLGHRGTGELLAVAHRQRRPRDPRAGADRLHGGGDRGRGPQPDDRPRRARHPADPHQRLRRHPPGRPRHASTPPAASA